MDNRELKNILDENLKKIVDLWRSLWHTSKKRRIKKFNEKNRRFFLLVW